MANQKLTQLSAASSVDYSDIAYIVSDPGGTPASNKCTAQDLVKGGASQGACSGIIDADLTASSNVITDSSGKITVTTDTYCRWRGSSSSEPLSPQDGDLWNDTTSGNVLKLYANSGWITLT